MKTIEISKRMDEKEGIIGCCLFCLYPVHENQEHIQFSGDIAHKDCYDDWGISERATK